MMIPVPPELRVERFWRRTGGLGGETSGERDWRAITPEADAPRLPRMIVAETRIT